jgi:hypothetical protein
MFWQCALVVASFLISIAFFQFEKITGKRFEDSRQSFLEMQRGKNQISWLLFPVHRIWLTLNCFSLFVAGGALLCAFFFLNYLITSN